MKILPTPGPWRVRYAPSELGEGFHVSATTPEGHPYFGVTKEIEIMSDEGYPSKEADAHLISAAPQLLEQLIHARAFIPANQPLLRAHINAVIAKAEGGTAS